MPGSEPNPEEGFNISISAIKTTFKATLEGKNFPKVEDARTALAPLKEMVNEHNEDFPTEHKTLSEVELEGIEISLDGKPFTAQLVQMGTTHELAIKFKGVDGQAPDLAEITKIWEE